MEKKDKICKKKEKLKIKFVNKNIKYKEEDSILYSLN